MVYSSNQRGLKYYIVVHPGGETGAISLEYHGYDALSVDGNEALVIESSIGELVQPQALAYEMDANGELDLLAWQPEYLVSGGEVTFDAIGSWTGDLVIEVNWGVMGAMAQGDPGWSTFYGGTSDDMAYDIVMAENGSLYAGGETHSTDFPLENGIQTGLSGAVDAFVGGFDIDYDRLWMTYYGGNAEDRAFGVAHDFDKWVYLCGETGFPGLATQPIPHLSTTHAGGYINTYASASGFIARFNDASGLIDWSTSFGGGSQGTCIEIECDKANNVYLIGHNSLGYTTSTCSSSNNSTFPMCNLGSNSAVLQQGMHRSGPSRGSDAFVAKFSNSLILQWSTLVGGDGDDYFNDLAIDHYYQRLYIVGKTGSARSDVITSPCSVGSVNYMPICTLSTGYNQIDINGSNSSASPNFYSDGLILQFSLEGVLEYSSYYGGGSNDNITSIAILPQATNKTENVSPGKILIAGVTSTSYYGGNCAVPTNYGFPSCSTGTQYHEPFQGGLSDAFIALLDYDKLMLWSTFFGGQGSDDVTYGSVQWPFQGPKVAIHENGEKYIFGETQSGSNTLSAIPTDIENDLYYESVHSDNALSVNSDCFVTRFDPWEHINYSTYFGGEGAEYNGGIALYDDRIYISGGTKSIANFPLKEFDQSAASEDYFQNYSTIPGSTNSTKADAFFAQLRTSNLLVPDEEANILGNEDFELLIYPNPTRSEVSLEWFMDKPGKVRYSIQTLLGIKVLEKESYALHGANTEHIDLSKHPSGIYIISLESNNFNVSRKLILAK